MILAVEFNFSKAQQMRRIAACINRAIIEKDISIENDGKITITDFAEFEI